MQAIIEFFTAFADVIENVIEFLFDFIGTMIDLVVMLGEAALAIPMVFAIMPPPATVVLTAILTIAITYKMIGRE